MDVFIVTEVDRNAISTSACWKTYLGLRENGAYVTWFLREI
jgi:hypothetical protein